VPDQRAVGFFDRALGADELNGRQVAYQVVLIAWTPLVGVIAELQAVSLQRRAEPQPAYL
jgi:hypothetical protein